MKKILTSALWGILSLLCLAGVLTGHPWHIGTGLICITMTLACLPTKEELAIRKIRLKNDTSVQI